RCDYDIPLLSRTNLRMERTDPCLRYRHAPRSCIQQHLVGRELRLKIVWNLLPLFLEGVLPSGTLQRHTHREAAIGRIKAFDRTGVDGSGARRYFNCLSEDIICRVLSIFAQLRGEFLPELGVFG